MITSRAQALTPPAVKGFDHTERGARDAVSARRFVLLTLFTGPECNLNCPYCFTGHWDTGNKSITLADYSELVEASCALGAKAVWWVGQGEPFLVPFWRDLVLAGEALGLWCGIFTNGTRLDDKAARFVLEHDVSIYMKVNSFDHDIQGKLVGGDGKRFLDTVLPRIEWFVEQGMASQRRLAVESVITKLNYDEMPTLFRWCRDRGIIPFIEMMEHACEGAEELDVSREEHVSLFRALQRIDREEYGYEWDLVPPWVAYRCRNIYLGLAIDAWGNVTPCSGVRYCLGNIREKSLKEIWGSEDARRFRDPSRQEPQPWDGTTLGCYGCKSHAYHVTGDPFAIDPRCAWFTSCLENTRQDENAKAGR